MKSSIWGIMVLKIPYCKIVRIKNMWATIGHYCHILRENSQLDRDQIFKGRGHNELKLIDELCPTLCDPMDCSLPGASVHEILQAGKLEWVAMPFSRGSFQLRDWTGVSIMTGIFLIIWTTRETPEKSTQGLKRRVALVPGSDHNPILGKSWIFLPLFPNLVSLALFGLRNWFAN